MHRTLLIIAAVATLAVTGVVHGLWTDRWSDGTDLVIAGERLGQLPMNIGSWEGHKLETRDDKKLNLAGQLSRLYTNKATGKRVTLYMTTGRPGPVSIHTPDICYAGSGYVVEKPKNFAIPGLDTKTPQEFFTSRLTKQKNDGQNVLRIFWGWHTQKGWQTSDSPRLAFAGEKILHKMYVVRDMAHAEEPMETEVCLDFMKELIPVLQSKLFTE